METTNDNDLMNSVDNSLGLVNILFYSTQLGVHYHLWEDNEDIHKILDLEENTQCKWIKTIYSNLDEKSIKCVVLAMYLYMFSEINKICNQNTEQ